MALVVSLYQITNTVSAKTIESRMHVIAHFQKLKRMESQLNKSMCALHTGVCSGFDCNHRMQQTDKMPFPR